MYFFVFHRKCPRCNQINLWRVRRRWWMRLVWGSRRLECKSCREKFVFIQPIKMLIFIAVLFLFIFLFIFWGYAEEIWNLA